MVMIQNVVYYTEQYLNTNKMARPQRNNVDYFPFFCKEGKSMFYIEQKYGNDGLEFKEGSEYKLNNEGF